MSKSLCTVIGSAMLLLLVGSGCQSDKALPLEESFGQIVVGQSNSAEVLALVGERGLMQTASGISVVRDENWNKEAGLVRFGDTDSLTRRKAYLQQRSVQMLLLTHEKLRLEIQTVVPSEVLDKPYETTAQRDLAVVEYCHEAMISDAKPYTVDRPTESLVALARTAMGIGILNVKENVRHGGDLGAEKGFTFDHPTLGRSNLKVTQDSEEIFTVTLTASDVVDAFNTW